MWWYGMNRREMEAYRDTKDRHLINSWFTNRNIPLINGTEKGVDLEGSKFDIEISHLSFDSLWDIWKKENRFRIEIRKRNHYWNGIYNKSHTTHFIQLNKSRNEMLIYPEELILEYANGTEVLLEYLMKYKDMTVKQSTFMCIPFDKGKGRIYRYKGVSGNWKLYTK